MRPFRRRVRQAPCEHTAEPWSSADRACLQRTLDPLHNKFRMQPLGFLRSEASTMLCARPADVYERLTSMLSSASIVSGLVLSAMAGAALNPFDLREFDDDPARRAAAEWFNGLAAFTVVTQLCVVLYSSFTLYILTASAHAPVRAYQSVWVGVSRRASRASSDDGAWWCPRQPAFGGLVAGATCRAAARLGLAAISRARQAAECLTSSPNRSQSGCNGF